jgi:fructuronate reductase
MGKDTEKVLDHIASSQVSTVFMSVLAKHYFLDRNNQLNIKNADIAADIANPLSPRTAIGILVEGIRRRMEKEPESFLSVFCAENLPSPSGPIVKQVLLDYCRAAFPSDRQLCDYVKGRVFVPSVSVDRVCPDDTNAFPNWRDEMSEETGIIDNRIIRTEGPGDFEVVIDVGAEDQLSQEKDAREFFILNNPFSGTSWPDQVVITYGDGVKYGITKQRVINATHVVAAMIGTFFLGPDTPVHEVLLHEKYGPMIKGHLENEMIPSLESNNRVPVKRDIGAYAARSWGRLSNPALPDPVFRIDQGVYGRLPRVLQMELELEAKAEEGVFPMAPAVTTAIWTILRTLKLRAGGVAYTPVDSAEVLAQVEAAKEACSAELEKDSVQGTIAVFARLANAEVFGKAGTEDTDFRRKVIAKIREFVPLCYPHKQQNEMVH